MAFVSQSHRPLPPVPAGGASNLPLRRLSFAALGTQCEVQYAVAAEPTAAAFEQAVVAWVTGFEAKYSRFRPDSLLSRINAAAGGDWVAVDAEMEMLLKIADTLHFTTQGLLDPTALPLIQLWNHAQPRSTLPTAGEIAAARARVGWKKVQRAPGKIRLPEPGMALDFGGFGKEFAVDFVAQIAANHGIATALIDFGHDLRAIGVPPGRSGWHIGLEDPHQPGTAAGSIAVGGKAVASSGDYVRCFEFEGKRYGHIIDPRTGWPVANGCLQATVVAGTCLQAGALSTTAFVLGIPKGVEFIQGFPGAEGLLVSEQARAQTRGFLHYVAACRT